MNELRISSYNEKQNPKNQIGYLIINILNKKPIVLPIVIFICMFIVMAILMGEAFSLSLLTAILQTTLPLLIISFGQTLVVLTGGIDLGIAGIMSLSTALLATQMTEQSDMTFWLPFVTVIGFAIGLIDGYIIVKTKIQPFIVTLASWSIFSGVALKILPTQGGAVAPPLINFAYGSFLGLNTAFWITLVVFITWVFLKKTRFGMAIYAVGSNETAARLNGHLTGRTKMIVYAISGFFASIAGIYFAALTNSGSSVAGDPFVMRSIASVVIGGTSLAGGRGNYSGTILGALILSFITQIIFFAGAQSAYSQLFQGVLLIIAMLIYSVVMMINKKMKINK